MYTGFETYFLQIVNNSSPFLSHPLQELATNGTAKEATQRFFFDITFFIIINTIGFNIVFGIIVDTFSELRDERVRCYNIMLWQLEFNYVYG